MKIKFNPNLEFQNEAIDAVVNIFEGNPTCQSNFTVAYASDQTGTEGRLMSNLGIGNKLDTNFDEEDIRKNVNNIQLKNGLAQSDNIKKGEYHFTIEMETGTGKTFVYLRTIFELNKKYGFTKFIIVVPSVAIKEGVMTSIDMMTADFKQWYDNVIFSAKEYKSKNIESIREFATADNVRIMVMTVQSFNKDSNVINKDHERTNGLKPLEFIRDTHPIVIIDEPQTTVSTKKSNDAVMSLNPLCTLRYSATHKDKHNLMFRLDAVDAYQRQLVKQIEVASVLSKDNHNDAYLKLISVDNKKMPITAKIEIDVSEKNKIKREVVTVQNTHDLHERSGYREQYSGYLITGINTGTGNESVQFANKDRILLGESRGDMDDDVIKRKQIHMTIKEHLDKEKKLKKDGIKVLSLFFIDKVSNYRTYDEKGFPIKGKYAKWFEEEYKNLIQSPKYITLFNDVDIDTEAEYVHNGYFAKDKKKDSSGQSIWKESKGSANTAADEDIYSLIMRDKERLLSFDSKLKFIFSHSALKEGWDNPNVFQICTLNETKSKMKKRQEIGRGLRLAVDQDGNRTEGFEINTLTVMANESYEDFAAALQKDIEDEEAIKFGIIEKHTFANITIVNEAGEYEYLNQASSEEIWSYLKENNYIDNKGKVTDELKNDLKSTAVSIPDKFQDSEQKIIQVIKKIAGNLNIKNKDDKVSININKRRYLSPEFKELWNRVKYKTTFSVDFDTEKLIQICSEEIMKNLKVEKAKLIYSKGLIDINEAGAVAEEEDRYSVDIEDMKYILPDVITYLQNETNLTRKTLVRILKESKRLDDFKKNPQKFMDEVSLIIQRKMRYLIVDGIKYERIGDEAFYAQELFENEELTGYLSKNMLESDKSVYDYVVYDSDVEAEFAKRFEHNERVKVYTKLPGWFRIETPLGDYNPDWAVFVEKDGEEKLYFVIETKGNIIAEELRAKEWSKIKCGEKHFEAIGSGVKFERHDDFNKFIENI
jgi:type III restriction enzyme